MIRLKGCNRCRGDLILEEDIWLCLQCGNRIVDTLQAESKPKRNYTQRKPTGYWAGYRQAVLDMNPRAIMQGALDAGDPHKLLSSNPDPATKL